MFRADSTAAADDPHTHLLPGDRFFGVCFRRRSFSLPFPVFPDATVVRIDTGHVGLLEFRLQLFERCFHIVVASTLHKVDQGLCVAKDVGNLIHCYVGQGYGGADQGHPDFKNDIDDELS